MKLKSRMRRYRKRLVKGLALTCCVALLAASKSPTSLERIKSEGKLTVLSRNGPTTFYEDANGNYSGFEYDLLRAFADELRVDLEIRDVDNLENLFDHLVSGEAHIAAAGLTVTRSRRDQIRFTPSYFETRQQVIYRQGVARPKSVRDLTGKTIAVVAGSAHAEELQKLKRRNPELQWAGLPDADAVDLIESVHNGQYDYAIVDSSAYSIHRGLFPKAIVGFHLTQFQPLAWALPKSADDSLYREARSFLVRANDNGLVAELREKHYGHITELNTGGAKTFARAQSERLPKWQKYLEQAGEKYNLDWQLLAAVSYQESHWNPRARSRTGVRGLMMLTRATAKEMGVKNRVDPLQSIEGGARYFRHLLDSLPDRIREPDRTWLALAAYNVGRGHLEDARVLTEKLGGNPDKWTDVRDHLPLLAKRQYYRQLKHGYARGWEPVTYVQNIRHYYTLLSLGTRIEEQRIAKAAREAAEGAVADANERENGAIPAL
ncbi:membrane-bound lytic murein transglycosylase MltF [Biformimicrobium ophioploci]|uniref:Membrane-bound lytic murein transglycosylase F n=1 Tax=Biformimicrobium ophioploci TaxID=3036711 RepID=A0ABQ6LZE8_9GAMM|nr:membrane-bound lytic murein transglycosylase MltF [Microbulbifer sp. NKW57]GMG87410.1 membrane-bound lytic murein transglycosylase MltF [Microbulbifer sp. NKW57]